MELEILWWHWAILAGALIVVEMLGAGGFLMGIAVSGLLLALLTALTPMGWALQIMVFAVLAAVLSFVYIKRFRSFNEQTDRPELNNRLAQLVGSRGEVVAVGAAHPKVKIGDSLWSVEIGCEVAVGDKIEVTAVVNGVLQAKKVAA